MKTYFQTALLAIALSGTAALRVDSQAGEEDDAVTAPAIKHVDDAHKPKGHKPRVPHHKDDEMKEIKIAVEENLIEDIDEVEEEENCYALDGTDSDAQEFESVNEAGEWTGNILRYALWVETSLIPRNDCLARNEELTWTEDVEGGTFHAWD